MKNLKKLSIILLSIFCITFLFPSFIPSSVTTVQAAKVKISKSKATLYTKETLQLSVKNTNKKVKWSSSNRKITSVNSKGRQFINHKPTGIM